MPQQKRGSSAPFFLVSYVTRFVKPQKMTPDTLLALGILLAFYILFSD